LIGIRSPLQCARRNRRIIVEQRHAHKRLARFVEIAALKLDVAREQPRLRIHLSFRL
jgi:hypothetical protein